MLAWICCQLLIIVQLSLAQNPDNETLQDLGFEDFYSRPDGFTNTSYIIAMCPHVSSERYSPNHSGFTEPLKTYIRFRPEFFYGINDVEEILDLSALLGISWDVPCPEYGRGYRFFKEILTAPEFYSKPLYRHLNSAVDPGMWRDFDTMFKIESNGVNELYPEAENLFFRWDRYGVFHSFCNVSLRYFPFGQSECGIVFVATQSNNLVNLSAIGVEITHTFLTDRGAWRYESYRTVIDVYVDEEVSQRKSKGTIYLTFRRLPDYYIYNLLCPSCVLTGLELVALLLPPNEPDRSTFTMTILLSLVVLQGGVLDRVPITSERIFLNDYILLNCVFATICSCYTCLMCCLSNQHGSLIKSKLKRKVIVVCSMSITLNRFLDIIAFLFGIVMVLLINTYAIVVSSYSNYQ